MFWIALIIILIISFILAVISAKREMAPKPKNAKKELMKERILFKK